MYSSSVLNLAGNIHPLDSQIKAITTHDAIVYLPTGHKPRFQS